MNAPWKPVVRALVPALLTACGAAQPAEPPSGAVDPGASGLAAAGDRGSAPRVSGCDGPGCAGDPTGLLGGVGLPAAGHTGGGAPPGGAVGEAAGKVRMTREHCETLGRKFAELTTDQGGAMGGGDRAGLAREADRIGRDFADRCARDMAGQDVEAREYQCMLRARVADELLGCRK